MDVKSYSKAKQAGYKLVKRKDMKFKKNNQSADWIMPSFAVGCPVAKCSYCYVARHREFGNPLHLDTDIKRYVDACIKFEEGLPPKYPHNSNQQDTWSWVVEIGESSDLLSPNLIVDTDYMLKCLVIYTGLKPTFATKLATPYTASKLSKCVRPQQARIRVSLMPQRVADVIEVGTAKMIDRIRSIRALYLKDYEVHINFSPVVIHDEWVQDYIELLQTLDEYIGSDFIGRQIKQQLKCEVIMLLHHPGLHESNLNWNSEAEELLWAPRIQEFKTNNRGSSDILRYKMEMKRAATRVFTGLIEKYLPYCQIRYMF